MITHINKYYNKPTNGNEKARVYIPFLSAFLIVAFLSIDSVYFSLNYFDGRNLVNFGVILYFFLMLGTADSRLRRLMIMMVPLSFIGEVLFSLILGMYEYRENTIPLYVPFGHAIVYGSGYMFSFSGWAVKHYEVMKKIFLVFFILLFLVAGLFFYDILSLILGGLFFYALRRKKWNNLYYYVAIIVLIVEYAGTYFGVWFWEPYAFGFIPTVNPPVGAVFLYIGGDTILLKLMRFLDRKNLIQPIGFEREKEIW